MKKVYIIDGKNFQTLEEFYDEISKILIPGASWGRNLDAFDDILDGGYGTPDEGFVMVWKHAKKSQQDLGYAETLRWLENNLKKIHPTNIDSQRKQITLAKSETGITLFLILVDIIVEHDQIELRLE